MLAVVDRPVFVALPSPGYLAAVGSALDGPADVDAIRRAGAALAAILHAEIEALAAEGVAYVALGNPLYPVLITVEGRERLPRRCPPTRRRRGAGRDDRGRPGRGHRADGRRRTSASAST